MAFTPYSPSMAAQNSQPTSSFQPFNPTKAPIAPPQAPAPAAPAVGFPGSNAFTPASQPVVPDATRSNQATFPATGNEGPLGVIAKTLGNIPASAFNFGKGVINFFNPLNTVKTAQDIGTTAGQALDQGNKPGQLALATVKGLPAAAVQTLVPQFIQHIFNGDTQKAAATIENDPVGQILPLILVARSAAEAAGKGAEFDSAISKVASPVTTAGTKAVDTVGNIGAQALGASTGTGAASIKEAFNHTQAFIDAMRGQTNPDEVVQNAQSAVQNIKNARGAAYSAQLANLGENTTSLDISPVHQELQSQLENFGIKVKPDGTLDFSRSSIANSGSARADVQGVYDTLKTWGTQAGDRTPIGLDTLKKQLGDFYSESGSARAFVQAVKSKLTNILNEVPGYKDMTSGYSKASSLLDDIKSATGAGSKAKVDTVFTKLTTALKGDKELRLEVLNEMQAKGAQPDLMAQIAGTNMQSYIPKGLVGRGLDVGALYAVLGNFFSPTYIPALLITSPRVVGEFVNALGLGAAKTQTVLNTINKLRVPTAATGAVPQSNKPKTSPPK